MVDLYQQKEQMLDEYYKTGNEHSDNDLGIWIFIFQAIFRTRCSKTAQLNTNHLLWSAMTHSDFWRFKFFSSFPAWCLAECSWTSCQPSQHYFFLKRRTEMSGLLELKLVKNKWVSIEFLYSQFSTFIIVLLPSKDLQICCDLSVTLLILQDDLQI